MKNLLKSIVTCLLSVMLSSCIVTGMMTDDYGEAYVNYYPYYFCPDLNFYFNPDLNIYWWYQGGLWRSGSQLPYSYHLGYNTNYVIISVSDRNPTLYYTQHLRDYRRGVYERSVYHYGDRPMNSLRNYRPDRTPSGYQSGKSSGNYDIYSPRRNQNSNNQGTRNSTISPNNGSRTSGTRQENSRGTINSSNSSSNSSRESNQQMNNGDSNRNGQSMRQQESGTRQYNNSGKEATMNSWGQPSNSGNQITTRQSTMTTPQRQNQPTSNKRSKSSSRRKVEQSSVRQGEQQSDNKTTSTRTEDTQKNK